jgi:hypothetical protein
LSRAGADRRARRLLRWYPRRWRARYGVEFAQLLIDDISDRPHSWRRTLDVARSGLAVRLARPLSSRSILATALGLLGVSAFLVAYRPWASMSSAQAARALERRLSSAGGAHALGLGHTITDPYRCTHTVGLPAPGEPAWTYLCVDAVHPGESGFFVLTRGDTIAEISPAG